MQTSTGQSAIGYSTSLPSPTSTCASSKNTDGSYCRRAPPRRQWGRSCPYKELTMTRPKIGWVDPLALTEDYKKTLRDGAKKVPAAERAKVCAVTEHAIEYRENVKGAPD